MLHPERMPLNDAENAAVDKLIETHGTAVVQSLTRRDPEESGPLLVHIGEDVYEVADDGKTKKQR